MPSNFVNLFHFEIFSFLEEAYHLVDGLRLIQKYQCFTVKSVAVLYTHNLRYS